MENSIYRKNVFKTLSIKPAKEGLRYVSRNTVRTNTMHAAIGIFTEAGEFVTELIPYLLGVSQLTEQMKIKAFEEMGDIGYYLAVLSRSLKVKLPASSKKAKLKGQTRSAAILEVLRITSEIAGLSKKVFYGPVMTTEPRTKTLVTLNPDGTPVMNPDGSAKTTETTEQMLVVDQSKTTALYSTRNVAMAKLLEELIPLYWALCYDLFEVPPSFVFVSNIAKLSKRYGEGFFQLSEAEARDVEGELEVMTEASK